MPCRLPTSAACLVDQVLRPDNVLLELLNGLVDAENVVQSAADDACERTRNARQSCRQDRAARAELSLGRPWGSKDQDEGEKSHAEFVTRLSRTSPFVRA